MENIMDKIFLLKSINMKSKETIRKTQDKRTENNERIKRV